jgi:hypothetical protein
MDELEFLLTHIGEPKNVKKRIGKKMKATLTVFLKLFKIVRKISNSCGIFQFFAGKIQD